MIRRYQAPNGDRYVQIEEHYYDALLKAAVDAGVDLEDLEDEAIARQIGDASQEEHFPSEFVTKLFDGENLVRLWREFRGMSLTDLASETKLLDEELAEIETDQQSPTVEQLKVLARSLKVSMDDLVR